MLRQGPCPETASVRPASTTNTTPLEVCCRSSPWSFRCHVVRQPEDPRRTANSIKHEWGALPLRVWRLPRVRLHVDLTILTQLASALAATRAVPLVT